MDDDGFDNVTESLPVLLQLQSIYARNTLYQKLEFMLGKAANEEERVGYYEDIEGLVSLYEEKAREFSTSNARRDAESEEEKEKAEERRADFIIDALYAAINGEVANPQEGKTKAGEEEEEESISRNNIAQLYQTMRLALDPECLRTGLTVGALYAAEEARAEEERMARQQEQEEDSALQPAPGLLSGAGERKAKMKVSPEEMFRMAQLVRSGLADEAELLQVHGEDEDTDIGIDLNENEPAFLARLGVESTRRRINYRALLPSEQLRQARTPQHRQAILQRLQERKEGDQLQLNSMQRAAQRQLKTNLERRIIAKREKQARAEQEQTEAAATAAADDAAGGILNTELDERKEEGSVFGPGKLPAKLPPWLRHGIGSRKPTFGLPPSAQSLAEQRRSLPIYRKRQEILDYVDTHSVTVLVGETGSGKTTQIPQYLAEHGYGKRGVICCTQPRRVAAETLAARVAEEYGCRLGEEVGYTVRFRDVTSSLTRIKYMTDGMLLREALLDDSFQRYSVIILDEAHERSISTDLLFAIVKQALAKHSTLKVLITSATLETQKFCRYFGVDSPFVIEGRTFPVQTYYLREPTEDYVSAALQTVMKIHLQEPPGDVLVFFTGQEEIELGGEMLHNWMKELRRRAEGTPLPDMLVLPLTATMPQDVQSRVFEPTPPGTRKVVLATNVAETSITISNLYYVVDSGFCKQSVYDPKKGMEHLQITPVSQAQAKQRSGRAGRIGPGKCYRIYTEDQFTHDMVPETVPDIMRANLLHVTLQLRAMGIDLARVELMDRPPLESVVSALEKLRYLEALDDDGLLTPLGGRMAQLSIDPAQSKTLLTAVDMGCPGPVLTIVSMLAVQKRGVFYRPRDRQEEADAAHRQFSQPEGDHITLMAVYDAWVEAGMEEEWSKRHFLKHRMLIEARDTREQLAEMLTRSQRHLSHDKDGDLTAVRRAITAGFFHQAARRVDSHALSYVTLADHREVYVHPSSVLRDDPPRYVLYDDLRLTKREYMTEILAIEPQWLVELAPAFYTRPKGGRRLTRAQEAERLTPILKSWETGTSWRISKQKRQRR